MGLEVSNNKAIDKATLKTAQSEQALGLNKTDETSSSQQPAPTTEEKTEPTQTYKNVLTTLGITQTDDIEHDYDQAVKALEYKLRNATDASDKQVLLQLKSTLDYEVNLMGFSVQNLSSTAMTGATAMGNLNKQMLVMAGGFSASGK